MIWTKSITNKIRFFMDECLPPVIRDNRWFMYPFFWFWFKGKNLYQHMHLKSLVHSMSPEEFEAFYATMESKANDRASDVNGQCIRHLLSKTEETDHASALDVGCGRGYWLKTLRRNSDMQLTGCDVFETLDLGDTIAYRKANITNLPFRDGEFDVVFCLKTLEHIKDAPEAVAELKRVAAKMVAVVVPCQRYYYYTLDDHLNFFPNEAELQKLMGMEKHSIAKLGGDFVYIGYIE